MLCNPVVLCTGLNRSTEPIKNLIGGSIGGGRRTLDISLYVLFIDAQLHAAYIRVRTYLLSTIFLTVINNFTAHDVGIDWYFL